MEKSLLIVKSLGLVKQCPAGKPLPGCPFNKVAKRLGLKETYRLISALTDEDIVQLHEIHQDCYRKRQNSTYCEEIPEPFMDIHH